MRCSHITMNLKYHKTACYLKICYLKKALTLRNILVFFGSAVIDFSTLNTACSPISSCCWSLQGFWVFSVWLEQDGCPGRLGFCIQKKMLVIHIMIVCNCPVTILSVTEWIRSFLTAYFFFPHDWVKGGQLHGFSHQGEQTVFCVKHRAVC